MCPTLPVDKPQQRSNMLDNNMRFLYPDNANTYPRYAEMNDAGMMKIISMPVPDILLMLFLLFKLSDVFNERFLVDKSSVLAVPEHADVAQPQLYKTLID